MCSMNVVRSTLRDPQCNRPDFRLGNVHTLKTTAAKTNVREYEKNIIDILIEEILFIRKEIIHI